MSQTVIDPRSQAPSPEYTVPPSPRPTARPHRSNTLSIAALACAIVGSALAAIPLIVTGAASGVALGLVSAGLVFGVAAAVLGVVSRGRAVSKVLGMTGLVLGILALLWTIGGFACTLW